MFLTMFFMWDRLHTRQIPHSHYEIAVQRLNTEEQWLVGCIELMTTDPYSPLIQLG